jgi:DNA-binding LytR/AlgR family response regulator
MKISILDNEFNTIGHKMRGVFNKLGHEVNPYYNAQQIYEALEAMNSSEYPDLVFVDMKLDGDTTVNELGVNAAEYIVQQYHIPVIIYSSFAHHQDYTDKYANMVAEKGFDRSFYVSRATLESESLLRLLIQDAMDNYRHAAFDDMFEGDLFEMDRLRLGFLSLSGTRYEFVSKDEILYAEADGDNTIIYLANGNRLSVARNIGGGKGVYMGVGDKIARYFKNFLFVSGQNGGRLLLNLEKIKYFDDRNKSLVLDGVSNMDKQKQVTLTLSTKGSQDFKRLGLLITTTREKK